MITGPRLLVSGRAFVAAELLSLVPIHLPCFQGNRSLALTVTSLLESISEQLGQRQPPRQEVDPHSQTKICH
jgi:hypothetical protein